MKEEKCAFYMVSVAYYRLENDPYRNAATDDLSEGFQYLFSNHTESASTA